jgi:hypothetical protein
MADEAQKPGDKARPDDGRAAAKARTEALDALEERLEKLRFQFDQHFLGNEKRPPHKERDAFNRDLRRYDPGAKNAVDRFRHQNLIARFVTYDTYWGRILRAIEEGTYERDRFKADLHQKQRAAKGGAAPPAEATARADSKARAVADEAEAFLASLGAAPTVGLRGRPVAPGETPGATPAPRPSDPGALPAVGLRGAPVGTPTPAPMRGAPIAARPSLPSQPGTPAPAPLRGTPVGGTPVPAPVPGPQPMRGTPVSTPTAPAAAPTPAPMRGPSAPTPAPAPIPAPMRGAPVGGPATTPAPAPMRGTPVGGPATPAPAPMRGTPVGGPPTPAPAPMRGSPVGGAAAPKPPSGDQA